MPGFASYDQIINALTVNGKGEFPTFEKQSITTVAGGRYSFGYVAGNPGALTFGTALTATTVSQAVAGALVPFTDPTAPATKHLLSAGFMSTVAAGTYMLYDCLARYPLNGTVVSGTFTSVTLPTRDNNGLSDGVGVMAMVLNASATASIAGNLTLTYTNSAGVAGRTTGAIPLIAGAQHRILHDTNGFFMPLQAGDVGIRSIQSYTLSASITSPQIEIQLVRRLGIVPVGVAGQYTARNFVTDMPSMPKLFAGSALMTALLASTTSSGIMNGDTQYGEN